MSQDASRALVFELLDTVLRSWWTIVAGLCVGAAGAVVALNYIPKVYEAESRVRVSPPKIPQEFVRPTVSDDLTRRLMTLREAVLGPSFMEVVLERHYAVTGDPERREAIGRWLQSRLVVDAAPREGLLALSFRDSDPARAAAVVNTLVELCVEENSRSRQASAGLLTTTIRRQVAEAKQKSDAKERELASFLARHSVETTDFLEFNRRSLETTRAEITVNQDRQRELRTLIQRLKAQRVDSSLSAASTNTEPIVGTFVDPYTQGLRRLENELEALRLNYVDEHPSVKAKLREIDDFKARNRPAPDPGDDDTAQPTRPRTPLDDEIDAREAELAKLQRDEGRLEADMAKLRQRIEATPQSQAGRKSLEDEATALKEQVNHLERQLQAAEKGQELEQSDQGEALEVVSLARVPTQSVEPQPLRVYLVGLVIGLVLFVGPLPLRRMLHPVIGSEAGLRALSSVPLLVSIPRIPTAEFLGQKRRRIVSNVGLSLLSTAVLTAVLAYFRTNG